MLAIFAIICTAIIGLVNELTKDEIKAQEQLQLLSTLHSIIEPSRYNNDITQDCVSLSSTLLGNSTNDKKIQTAYIARQDNQAIAIAMTSTAPDGYNGNIELIIAINMDDSVSGVRVLKHQETPGLGDKVELRKSNWINSFTGNKLLSEKDSRWAVTKDNGMFDQFTGATITPRSVVKAVKKTLLYFKDNKHSLLTRPNICLQENERAKTTSEANNEH
ncbi:MAG: electron transport complex subunit RsxG [Colwellia sp.]|nr:electron transport complex subunit RsxG [Colwellia sp.]